MMSGLTRERARLPAEVRIKYVDFQADPTQWIDKAITPIVSGGRTRTKVSSRGIRLFCARLSSAELADSTIVFGAGPGSAWCLKRELSGERKLDPVR
jgi:hypothetical protein